MKPNPTVAAVAALVVVATAFLLALQAGRSGTPPSRPKAPPALNDDGFVVRVLTDAVHAPTSLEFIGNDLLVLEKDTGRVRLVRDSKLVRAPLAALPVLTEVERGLLGLTHTGSHVYIYATQKMRGDDTPKNYIHRYRWDGNALDHDAVITRLPGNSLTHHGGAMVADREGNVYAVIGDQNPPHSMADEFGLLQNYPNGDFDDTSVILKVGGPLRPSRSTNPLLHYHAVGVRNSFGLAIDPVTGALWATENGDDRNDEVNFAPRGFNSGWAQAIGPATDPPRLGIPGFTYRDPAFTFESPVAPTALVFVDSPQFSGYANDLLVAGCNFGRIYRFVVNEQRDGFVFRDARLTDSVLNAADVAGDDASALEEILFGSGFGCITDLAFGPNGHLYVASLSHGSIYEVLPRPKTPN